MELDVSEPGELKQLVLNFDKADGPIEGKFWEFHNANPRVYEKLKALAFQAKARGFKNYSIDTLFEILRWHTDMETTGSMFKLNNNYRAYYARLLMKNEPGLYGFFNIRKRQLHVIE